MNYNFIFRTSLFHFQNEVDLFFKKKKIKILLLSKN